MHKIITVATRTSVAGANNQLEKNYIWPHKFFANMMMMMMMKLTMTTTMMMLTMSMLH